jgi:hypothetical protein
MISAKYIRTRPGDPLLEEVLICTEICSFSDKHRQPHDFKQFQIDFYSSLASVGIIQANKSCSERQRLFKAPSRTKLLCICSHFQVFVLDIIWVRIVKGQDTFRSRKFKKQDQTSCRPNT